MLKPQPIALEIPLDDITGFGPSPKVSVLLFLPQHTCADRTRIFAVCLHGGGYSNRYFDIDVPGHADYSMARHLADHGVVAAAIDCLGNGESSRADEAEFITWQNLARAHHLATARLIQGLVGGTLVPGLEPLPHLAAVGIGHSLGGMLLATQQATLRTFDRLAILGWSNLGLVLPASATIPIPDATGRYFYTSAVLREAFHMIDVPAAARNCEVERENHPVSATLAAQAFDTSALQEIVKSIDVPLFLGFGEKDTSPDAHGEVAVYSGARDVTLFILKGSAHCHNFASTRRTLWDRIGAWMAIA
jgi:pimeloyl-ACP methyl ester carboxylesterase